MIYVTLMDQRYCEIRTFQNTFV